MSICIKNLNRISRLNGNGAIHRVISRAASSKQMCETPGLTCCKAGTQACKIEKEEKKTKKEEKKIPKECLDNPCCPDPPIKYDEEFAHLLKHKERKDFQKTWEECPPRRTIQKVICSAGVLDEEPPECKEVKAPPPDLGCAQVTGKCPRITMPGCKPAQVHKKCQNYPVPTDCKKINAPYPSFSECSRPRPKPKRPTECECLALRSMCEVYTMMRKKGKQIKVKQ